MTVASPSSSAADALIAGLIRQGVECVYAVPGEQVLPLFAALNERRGAIRVIHTRHEQAAAYMAHGHARATGRPGVLIVPPGPGLLNALAGIAVGSATNAPMLCLTGQIPSAAIGRGLGLLHELPDQLATIRTLVKWAERASAPEQCAPLLATAFARMLAGRPGPVALEIPPDVLAAGCPPCDPPSVHAPAPPVPDDADLDRAAAMLRRASRPMIMVGGGAVGARAPLSALAERLQAPVSAHCGGRGIVSDHSYLALPALAGHALWRETDVVLAVGTRLAQPLTQWGVDEETRIIRVDIDAGRLGEAAGAHLALHGEAAAVVAALDARLAGHAAPSRRDDLIRRKNAARAAFAELAPQRDYVDALRAALPDDGVLVDELTQIGYACRIAFPVYEPRTYVTSGYQGALGYGFPTALGVKAACPGKAVLSVNGDGGFLYAGAELATAVQQRLGVVAVIFNDGRYGNVAREQERAGYALATDLHNPDFVALALSFGALAQRVSTPDDLRRAVRSAFGESLPTVIEVPVGAMPSPWHLIRLPRVRGAMGNNAGGGR